MFSRINLRSTSLIDFLLIGCLFVTTRIHAEEGNATLICPGTQLTDVQTVFPPCSNVASSVTFVVTSVDPVISYSISGGAPQSSPVFTNLAAGTYTLDLIVAPNCSVSFPFTISSPQAPFFTEVSQRDVSCTGNNGVIEFEVAGGTGPYSYFMEYSNGSVYPLSSDSIGGFVPGTYTVIVEDANGCEIDTTVTLLSYSFPIIGQIINTPSACGSANGSIEIILANPPVGVYTVAYSINYGLNYQSSNTFNNLAPGQYYVYATVNGCLSNMGQPFSVTVTSSSGISVSSVTSSPTICSANTGTIAITASVPNGTLVYSINGGLTYGPSPNFNNLAAGNYAVSIKNPANGCIENTSVTVGTVSPPVINGLALTPASCNAADGQITIQATSVAPGTLAYSINNGITYSSSPTFTGIGPGTYTILVQNQLNGCIQDTTIVMPTQSGPLLTGIQVTDANCVTDNGIITIQAQPTSGGNVLYSIDNGLTFANTGNFTDLQEGLYTIVLQNSSNGCTTDTTVTVGAIGAPVITALTVTNPTCSNPLGQVVVQASNPGNGSLVYSINGGVNTQSGTLFSNLQAGNYTMTVINQQNCAVTTPFSLLAPSLPTFSEFNVQDATCVNNDGIVAFNVSGGTGPYSYSVEYNGSGIFPLSSDSTGGFTEGTYQFFVEDVNGCTTDTTITILGYQFPMISDIIPTLPNCNASNGSIEILISNPPPATGSYTTVYSINGGLTYQASNTFENLPAGQYTIYVSVDGCLSGMGFPIVFNLVENSTISALDINLTPTDCSVANGEIAFIPSGNTALIYSIDGGITYTADSVFTNLPTATYAISAQNPVDGCQFDTTVVIETVASPVITDVLITEADCGTDNGQIVVLATDPQGSTLSYTIDAGNTFQQSGTFDALGTGTYTIGVLNEAGCAAAAIASIPDNSIPLADAGADVEICSGNSLTLTAVTSPGSSVSWTGNVVNGVSFVPGNSAVYTVTAIAQNGCFATDEVLVTVNEPVLPNINITSSQTCLPKQVTLTPENNDYSNCNWSVSNGFTSDFCGTVTFSVEDGGCYDVVFTATDLNGCTVNFSENDAFCLESGPEANFNYTPGTVTTDDALIQLTNTSENAVNYVWQLPGNIVSVAENPILSGPFLPGSYSVQLIASDENGCSDTLVRVITVETEFSVFVPNSFTPDGDEFNQVFKPVLSPGYDPTSYNLLLFNRWGQIIFESNNPEVGWDGTYNGKIVTQGTYTYKLIVRSLENAEIHSYIGHVNILR